MFALLFVTWMVFVTFSSLYSFSGDDLPSFEIPNVDKIVHFTFYFIAFILGGLYLLETKGQRKGILKKNGVLAFSLIIYGIIIEVVQGTLTVGRSGDIFDAMANSTGVAIGFVTILSIFYRQRGLK